MLKKIPLHELRLGMFIQSIEGSWVDHPFWRNRFVLESAEDLNKILSSAVKAVWIDVSKGVDVLAPPAAEAPPEMPDEVEASLREDRHRIVAERPCSMQDEVARATAICNSAHREVSAMFSDARMGKAISVEVARHVSEEIAQSVTRNAHALISLARLKTADNYTYLHSVAVCALMVALARQLGLSTEEVSAAGFAGLLHDLGKVDIPLEILNKPGRLTEAEFAIVRQHPAHGARRLMEAGVNHMQALDVSLHHHEKLDGSGYPKRLSGDQISLMARMGAVCDVYDAITSNRPYKAGWDPSESLARMSQWVNGHLDQRIFQAFVQSLGIYPVGSLVLLSNHKLAVVVEQSAHSMLKPIVKTVFSTKSQMRVIPERIDLSLAGCPHSILKREDPKQWKLSGLAELWGGPAGH